VKALRVIYRSTGRENKKMRPAFYSKLLSLASFLRSVDECEAEVDILFLNDGPIPEDRLALMEAAGEVGYLRSTDLSRRLLFRDQVPGIGTARSYLATLAAVNSKGWPGSDLVYFVEDDFMHLPVALSALVAAGEGIPEAAYFGLYANIDWARSRTMPFTCYGYRWHQASSTTSTFAGRIGALRADRWIHRLAFFAGQDPDMDASHAVRGVRPYPWSHVTGDLLGYAPGPSGSVLGRMKRAGVQSAMNVLAVGSSFHRHQLVAPVPPLATHVEEPYLALAVDWEQVARDTRAWAESRGIRIEEW
jgi:hypothetical protein